MATIGAAAPTHSTVYLSPATSEPTVLASAARPTEIAPSRPPEDTGRSEEGFIAPDSLDAESSTPLLIDPLNPDSPVVMEPVDDISLGLGDDDWMSTGDPGLSLIPSALDVEKIVLEPELPSQLPLDNTQWDLREFQTLKSASDEIELVDAIAEGTELAPVQPLTPEEVLATDQAVKPLGYAAPGLAYGMPVPLTPAGKVPKAGYLPEGEIRLESAEFLDYDEERHTIYGHGRVVARLGRFKLEADRILVDTRIRELQAQGNVLITGPNEHVEAEAVQYDAARSMGVAYNARGRSGIFYFLADPHENGGRTTFRQLSKDETHFHDGSFTTCDFPVPHYRLRAKEFTILANDRIFARNIVLYIMETPVLWLPYYTRSLNDEGPWALKFGTDQQLGYYARIAYSWRHSQYTPSDVDDRLLVKKSNGAGRVMWDYFSNRGFGRGLMYKYRLDDNKHRGRIFAYQLTDQERATDLNEEERNYFDIFHRSSLGKACDGADLSALIDIDYASDPEIFYDLFDRLRGSGEQARGRIPERHAVFGLEATRDDYFAGLRIEMRDRIGRDRFSYFAEPRDDDFDFDRRYNDEQFFVLNEPGRGPDNFKYPNSGRYTDRTAFPDILDQGLASDRFGRVSSRLPQLTVSTNRERLWCLPLWYSMNLNVMNNLDKGLNVVGTDDDSYVTGFDFYQSLTYLKKFTDRYTLRTKVGLGLGVAQRLDDSFNVDFPDNVVFPYIQDGQVIDGKAVGVTFVDPETFLVGTRRMSLQDVDPAYAYTDIDTKFNARVSRSLTAWWRHRGRANLGNNLGQFYERVGDRTSKDDLYDFRTPENWVEAGLNYSLARPQLSLNFATGRNLQPESEFTADELIQYTNIGASWANLKRTLLLNGGIGVQQRQERDPSDPNAYLADTLTYHLQASYLPVHQRHYARVGFFYIENTTDDPLGISTGDRDFDTQDDTAITAQVGKKIGDKYLVEYRTRVRSQGEGNSDSYVKVERDFHDAVAGVSVGFRGTRLSNEDENTQQDNMQLRLHFRLKVAADKGVTPVRSTGSLFSGRKLGAFETGG